MTDKRRRAIEHLSQQVLALKAELTAARAERDKLQRFKDWVHSYLDQQGIPHHPPGTHGAEGCRIGDRMDYVFVELTAARAEIERLRKDRDEMAVQIRELIFLDDTNITSNWSVKHE